MGSKGFWSWDPAVFWVGIHQHNVGSDLFDTAPGNDVIFPPPGDPQQAAGSGHHDGTDLSSGDLDLDIRDKPQTLSVADADDFLALQISEFHGHGYPPFFGTAYAKQGRGMPGIGKHCLL